MNIYHVQVNMADARDWARSQFPSPLCLVIADSEADALNIMRKHLKEYSVEVSIPENASETWGHGMEVTQYMTAPNRAESFRDLINAFRNHRYRYYPHIYDESGELLWQNEVFHDYTVPKEEPKAPNIFVNILDNKIDEVSSGIAFVSSIDKEDNEYVAYILIAEKRQVDDSEISYQAAIYPDGRIMLRNQNSQGEWGDWYLDDVFAQQDPKDGKRYFRKDGGWVALELGEIEPDSEKLITAGTAYQYIEDEMVRVYKAAGNVYTEADVVAILEDDTVENGWVYNYAGDSVIDVHYIGDIAITLAPGDNFIVRDGGGGRRLDNLGAVIKFDAQPIQNSNNAVKSGGLYTEFTKKVDKIPGKGLSTEDYTTADMNKLRGLYTNEQEFELFCPKIETNSGTIVDAADHAAVEYVIYGAAEGVGNLVADEEDEHYNEYVIPVIVTDANSVQHTTNLYIPTPILEGQTVSLADTHIPINLYAGANTITFGTTVQPSAIKVKYYQNINYFVRPVTSVAGREGDIVLDKNDVGLSNVDNTADTDKPVSTAQQAAIDGRVPKTRTVAGVDLVDDITKTELLTALNVQDGAQVNDVTSVAGKTGAVTLVKGDVGLGNVDNTADADKPISTAVQSELTRVDGVLAAINGKIPEQATSVNKLADKEFVNSSIATNTAHYISDTNNQPFTSYSDLETYTQAAPAGTITNNDYAFITGVEDGRTYYDRWKATVTIENNAEVVTWAKEWRINNSSFTAEEWAAISSGITAALVGKITANESAISDLQTAVGGKYAKPSAGIPSTDMTAEVQASLAKADTAIQQHQDISGKYEKPVGGIPSTDLSAAVQASLGLADTALQQHQDISGKYEKPSTGIPKSDLAADVQSSLSKADTALQQHQDISGKQNTLVSGQNIKSVDGQSLVGSGNLDITKQLKIDNTLFGMYPHSAAILTGAIASDVVSVADVPNTGVSSAPFPSHSEITSISLPNATKIGQAAFYKAGSLTSISLPEVTHISAYAFTQVSIPDTETLSLPELQSVGFEAFKNCSIKNISVPKLTTLNYQTFAGNTKLVSIALPAATTMSSSGQAFRDCSNLEEVDMPVMSKIILNTFKDCSKLSKVILRNASVVTLESITAFDGTPFADGGTGGTVYVPQALIASYQSSANWAALYAAGTCTFTAIEGSAYEV